MSQLSFNMNLVSTNASIAKDMLRALLPDIQKYFNKVYNEMKKNIPQILINHIKMQPEYSSLLNGKLMGEFGLTDPDSRLSNILSTIESGAIIQTKPISISGSQIKGSIKLQMVQKDFSDLLSLGDASFTTEKGSNLQWLSWLLKEGDSIIIADYTFALGSFPSSRTGMGIMRQFGGSSWRVPPEFAGNISNNWITRAIDSASNEIEKELESLTRI
jgi:hypothetical protein